MRPTHGMNKGHACCIGLLLILASMACRPASPSATATHRADDAPQVFAAATYEVAKTTGIVYAEGMRHAEWGGAPDETVPLLLDVYEPVDAPGNRPAILFIHGGGFKTGSRTSMSVLPRAFAARGWVAFSIDYRLAADHGTVPAAWATNVAARASGSRYETLMAMYPAGRDAKAAVRWLYANAERYQVNTNAITAAGSSAGAFLSVMLGVSEPQDFRDELFLDGDPTLATTHLDQPARVQTVIDFWGGPGLLDALATAYGVDRFDATDAPLLIVHGEQDTVVDVSNAKRLQARYAQTGAPYEMHLLPGYGHGAWDADVDGVSLATLAFMFIVRQQGLRVQQ